MMRIAHYLNYPLKDIDAAELKWMGFDMVQVGPLQKTASPDDDWRWEMLYLPIGPVFGNRLATHEEFVDFCNRCHAVGIKVAVDVVPAHVAGGLDGSLYPGKLTDTRLANKREYWLDPIPGCNPDHDRWQCCNRCYGMPRVNYYNEDVVEMYKEYFELLLENCDTLRIDMAKHFSLPYEGGFRFWQMIKSLNRDIYGECIGLDRNKLNDYSQYIKCLTMNHDQHIDREKMIVMFESHDSFGSDTMGRYTAHLNNNDRLQRYENLVREFPNTLFFFRPYDSINKEEIRNINLYGHR